MRKQLSLLVLAAFVLPMLTGCAGLGSRLKVGETADGEVVEAEGLAAVTGDLIGTKRAALADAYKNAVEKVVGVFISARTMVDKAVTIQQNILGKTDGYVKKHQILREGKESDGLYHSHIRALVSYQKIQDDLKGLDVLQAPLVGNPRVAVLLDETIEGMEGQTTAASDAILQGFLDKGFKVVDRSELAAIRVAEATKQLLNGQEEAALKPISQKLNAEVVVTGRATASFLTDKGLGGLISYRATLTGKALKTQTADVLATVNLQASDLDATREAAGNKAMAKLGKDAAEELTGKIASALARKAFVLVTVRGLPNIDRLSQIKSLIARTPGVGDLYMRSYNAGTAEIDVKMNTATSADIASSVSNSKDIIARVISQTQDSLEVEVQ